MLAARRHHYRLTDDTDLDIITWLDALSRVAQCPAPG